MARSKGNGITVPIDITLDTKDAEKGTNRIAQEFSKITPIAERAIKMVDLFQELLKKSGEGNGLNTVETQLYQIGLEAQSTVAEILKFYNAMNAADKIRLDEGTTAKDAEKYMAKVNEVYGSMENLNRAVNDAWSEFQQAYRVKEIAISRYTENIAKEYTQLTATLTRLEQELSRTSPDSSRYAEINAQIGITKKRLEEVKIEQDKISNGTSSQIQAYQRIADKANELYKQLNGVLVGANNLGGAKYTTYIEELGHKIEALLPELTKYEQEINVIIAKAIAADKAQQRMGSSGAKAHQRSATYARRHHSILQSLLRILHKVVDAFKKLKTHTHKAFDSSGNGLKMALRNIMRYGLGVRSLYFLFRRLRKATKDAFGVMAMQWEPVNKQISSMIKSLNAVKGSLATMLQPLLGSFSAFFNSMMSVLQNIMETIGAFFAALTGQDYILRAHAGDIDWAESLAEDLEKAKDNAEELNKQLAGFDKINNLKTKDKKGKTDIGVGTVTYEKIPIEKLKIYSWLKEMWDKADFTELGDRLSNKLADMLESIDWDKFESFGKRLGKSVATGLNGFFANKRLAKDIGKTIAKLINTAFQTINSFATNFKWDELGLFLKTGIQSFLNHADTYDWGFSVGNVVTGITTAIYTLVSDPKTWKDLGNKIKDGIIGFLDSMSQPREVKIGERIIGHSQGHVITEDITKTMNGWEIAAGSLSGFATGLIDALNNALGDEKNWEKFGEGIGKFLANIKWEEAFAKTKDLAKNLLNGLVTAVQKAYDEDPSIVTSVLKIAFTVTITKMLLSGAATLGSVILGSGILTSGLGAGATAFLVPGGFEVKAFLFVALSLAAIDLITDSKVREKCGNDIANEINKLPEETKKALGPACLEGGVADTGWMVKMVTRLAVLFDWGKPKEDTTEASDTITSNLNEVVDNVDVSTPADTLTNNLSNQINTNLGEVFHSDEFMNFKNAGLEEKMNSQFGDISQFGVDGFNSTFEKTTELSGPNSPMQNAFQKGVDGVKEDVFDENSPSKVFKQIGEFVIEGFLIPFKTLPDLFKKVWVTAQNASVASINRMRVVVSNALNTVAGNIKAIMQTMLSNIGNSLGSIVDSVKSKLKGALESSISFSGITNSLSTVNKQWENMWSDMADTTKKKANSIIDSMNGMLKGLEILANTNADGTLTTGKAAKTFPRIPHLAQGAVIPPNKQFLAVLGDQKQGMNVEAPVSVIEDAVGRALKKYGVNVTFDVQGDPNGMFKVMQRKSNEFNRRTGLPSFT